MAESYLKLTKSTPNIISIILNKFHTIITIASYKFKIIQIKKYKNFTKFSIKKTKIKLKEIVIKIKYYTLFDYYINYI